MRTSHGEYAEYHTSADNLDFVRPNALHESLEILLQGMHLLENNTVPLSTNPCCEPQLGKRGLYRAIAGQKEGAQREMALLWVLNLSDGRHTLLDIAERAETPFDVIYAAAQALKNCHLLEESQGPLTQRHGGEGV